MSAFERLRQLPGRGERKQQHLDRIVLLGGFILQSESPHQAFWLPELHKKTKAIARMTVGPLAIIESATRLRVADRIARVPQPEPAPDCWHSAEAGGPHRSTLPGVHEVIAAYQESMVGDAADPVLAGMPEAIAEKFEAQISAATMAVAGLALAE